MDRIFFVNGGKIGLGALDLFADPAGELFVNGPHPLPELRSNFHVLTPFFGLPPTRSGWDSPERKRVIHTTFAFLATPAPENRAG